MEEMLQMAHYVDFIWPCSIFGSEPFANLSQQPVKHKLKLKRLASKTLFPLFSGEKAARIHGAAAAAVRTHSFLFYPRG